MAAYSTGTTFGNNQTVMAAASEMQEAPQTSNAGNLNDRQGPVPIENTWGKDITLINDRVIINDSVSHNNNVRRVKQGRGIDYDILKEHIDDTIYELIPLPPPLPVAPPPSGREPDGSGFFVNKLIVANWSNIYESGGGIDPEKDIHAGWLPRYGHDIPSLYGINPKFRFYTGDNPLFYIANPTSHYDPSITKSKKSISQRVLPESIVWRINGEEVKRGNYLQLFNVKKGDEEKVLTCDINNSAGTLSQTVIFEIRDSDEFDDAESLSALHQGFWTYNPTIDLNRGKAVWEVDPRYNPRRLKFRIKWSNYGNGKNKPRNFNERRPSIKIDGIQMIDKLTDENGTPYGSSIKNGNHVQKSKYPDRYFYFEKPPGPLSLEIYTQFNWAKVFKRKRRKFYKNFEYTVDLDSPLDKVIDLGTIEVGKRDENR